MVKEMQPEDTTRAMAYELWLNAPNPMVTFFKTLDVTNLIKISRKKGRKLHMLLDYCIGKAAVSIKEFYILPVSDKLMQYDTLAVNTIVKNKQGRSAPVICYIWRIWRHFKSSMKSIPRRSQNAVRIEICLMNAWSLERLLS